MNTKVIVLSVAGLLLLALYAITPPRPTVSVVEKIERQCKEQYAPNELRVQECRFQLMARFVIEMDNDKMDRAYRGIR